MKSLKGRKQFAGLDTNSLGAETAEFSVKDANEVHVFITAATGAHAIHVLELWAAGINEDNTSGTFFLVASSDLDQITESQFDMHTYSFVKVKVKTAEGETSTVDLLLNTYYTDTK